MASQKKTSLLKILRQRQRQEFVGREDQIALFERNIKLPLEHRRFIFNLSGQGGVGKTSLLRRFRQLVEVADGITAWSDENALDVPTVMGNLALQFEKQGCELKDFTERFRVYRQRRHELETDPEAPQGLTSFLGRTLAKTGVHLARRTPAIGVAFEFVDEDAFAAQAGDWVNYISRKLTNKDEIRLVQEPLEVLTPLFLSGLDRIAETNIIGVFLDTYERTSEYLDLWLRNLVDEHYGEVPANIVISIGGQIELDRNNWAPYEGIVARLPLELFTLDETKEYLQRKGITNERVVEVIINLSGHLPLLVATLASESPNDPNLLGDPSGTAVERFLKWVEDPKKREVALDAALPRQLNRDVITVIVGKPDSEALYAWLRDMPFVREEGIKYHPVVRTQILRHKRRQSPQGWADLHGKLGDYYLKLRDSLSLSLTKKYLDPTWRRYALETGYHRLCQSPQKEIEEALSSFLVRFDNSRSFAREWAESIQQAGEDCEDPQLRNWAEGLLTGVKAYDEHRYEDAAEMFTRLLRDGALGNDSRAICLNYRGYLFTKAELYDKALSDLTNALELKPDEAEYWMDIGELRRHMKDYPASVRDYSRALELAPSSTRALTGRGYGYLLSEDFESALKDFTMALEAKPKYAWALFGRARCYAKLQRNEDARRDFERTIEVDADYKHLCRKLIGLSLFDTKRYNEAAEAFGEALNAGPACHECWSSLARALNAILSPAEIVAHLRAAIPQEAYSADIIAYRGDALRRIGLSDESEVDFTEALKLDSENPNAMRGRASIFLATARPAEALIDINACINLTQNEGRDFAIRGEILAQLGRQEEALSDYQQALELDPGLEHSVLTSKGRAFISLLRFSEAKTAFVQALNREPACNPCWKDLVRTCKALYAHEDVPAIVRELEVRDLSTPFVQACLANGLMENGYYADALVTLESPILTNETLFLRFGNNQGLLLAKLGRYAEAVDTYERLLSLSRDASVLYNLAIAKARWKGIGSAQQSVDAALAALTQALDRKTTRGGALYGLGGLSAVVGDHTQAWIYLEQAIPLEKEVPVWLRQDVAWLDMSEDLRFKALIRE